MCGITGFIDYTKGVGADVLGKMTFSLRHRGPDDNGLEFNEEEEFCWGIGHTRLAILDLSLQGHQPMGRGHSFIVLNGEIYNYKEIRSELEGLGIQFSSNSDTEVVLQSYIQWGENCVSRFIGMFAYAIYDSRKKKLHLCRDRAGVKPLYYYIGSGEFLFSSELKSFHEYPNFVNQISKQQLQSYLSFGYVSAPYSIYENTFKVEPGNYINIDIASRTVSQKRYWVAKEYFSKPIIDIGYNEAKHELKKLLQSACEYRMVADVPVGIFLSGGYDSTLVTALLQKERTEKLRTFTIGFQTDKDEAPFAKQIAEFLGTSHTTHYCSQKETVDIIPELSYYYDEPCADISCIPTILVSKVARKSVKVSLSADGGDELFAGYTGYITNMSRWKFISNIPLMGHPVAALLFSFGEAILPTSAIQLSHKVKGIREVFEAKRGSKIIKFIKSTSKMPDSLVGRLLPKMVNLDKMEVDEFNSVLSTAQYFDFTTTLPDLLLTKVDRATMSVSLEGREPLLDHRLFEFAAQLPPRFKNDGTRGKIILKDIVHEMVPKEIMDRPKMGFDIPIFEWLRGELSYLLDEYLNHDLVKKQGIFDPIAVQRVVELFLRNRLIYDDLVWRLLVFQMWHKRWNSN